MLEGIKFESTTSNAPSLSINGSPKSLILIVQLIPRVGPMLARLQRSTDRRCHFHSLYVVIHLRFRVLASPGWYPDISKR